MERQSKTLKHDYFYVATYFPADSIIIRSALPYNNDLSKSLKADQHYIWFAIFAIILLTVVLYRFMHRLGKNVAKLRIFAYKADHILVQHPDQVFPCDAAECSSSLRHHSVREIPLHLLKLQDVLVREKVKSLFSKEA